MSTMYWNDPNLMVGQMLRPRKSVVLLCVALGVEPPPACFTLRHRLTKRVDRVRVPMRFVIDHAEALT